jgi:hypothetical protein
LEKSQTRLLGKIRCQLKVNLRLANAAMAKIRCQVRQQLLDVLARAIPTHQSIDRKGVAQIMQPRLKERVLGPPEPHGLPHEPVTVLGGLFGNTPPVAIGQKRFLRAIAADALPHLVSLKHVSQAMTNRH